MLLICWECSSLSSLPNISKWNVNNFIVMRSMLDRHSSLLSLPDISKWNINNFIDLNSMLYECSSLLSLPDISKWNTNIINIKIILVLFLMDVHHYHHYPISQNGIP